MALSAARGTFVNHAAIRTLLGKHVAAVPIQIQVATMRATYGEKYPYLKAWPYEKTKFNLFHEIYDNSLARLNENSKVIIVEGNVGCGKHEFAKRLANNFDLKYIPAVTEDEVFFTPEKFDMRSVDDLLPESARQYTNTRLFHGTNPECGTAGRLQYMFYKTRFDSYYKALLHLFSTGQGIVMVRSPFSDRVFAEALRRMGWVSKKYLPWYDDVVDNSVCVMLKPHITVYLDTPVDVCMKNIKGRSVEAEKGQNFSEKYLSSIETVYRDVFLPKQRISGEVIEIDWAEVGDDMDLDVITEEISELHLECASTEDPKFQDWRVMNQDQAGHYRKLFASDWQMENLIKRPIPYHLPEVLGSDEDNNLRNKILWQHPAIQYRPGWCPEFGDKTLLKM